jgi:tetratricopeptide (TPR) repeat protein
MSTPVAPSRRPEAALRALARRAQRLRRAGRLERAADLAEQAVRQAAAVSGATQAELVALACGIALDAGRLDGVPARLEAAIEALRASPPAQAARDRLAVARLQLETGRALAMRRDLNAARPRLEAAAAAPDATTLEGEPAALIRVRAQAGLGALLCMHGNHAQGQQMLTQALAEAERCGLAHAGPERARILINLGASHFEQQQIEAAGQRIEQALAALEPLVHTRRAGARADVGRAWANLGSIHTSAGRLPQALAAFRAAIAAYDRALRCVTQAGDVTRLRASRANAAMNLGYTLFQAGDFVMAQRQLAGALRRFGPLLAAHPHLAADAARALVNAAHVHFRRGNRGRAAALYRRGLEAFETLQRETAAPHLDADRANAMLGLARVELVRGRAAASSVLFERAMTLLSELTQHGRLHHANAWLQGWLAQASLLLEHTRDERRLAPARAGLMRSLQAPPVQALGGDAEPLRVAQAVLATLQRWLARDGVAAAARQAGEALADAALRRLFDMTAGVLADSAPQWLAQHQAGLLQRWVGQLGDVALAHPRAGELLVAWFLRSRGLRAQRLALAGGSDSRLAALREALAELHRLEAELLGQAPSGDAALLAPARGGEAAGRFDEHAAQWQSLRASVMQRIDQSVRDGLLPPSLRLEVADLKRCLAPRHGLVLAARLDGARLLLVALALRADGTHTTRHRVTALPQHLAERSCHLYLVAAREALRQDLGTAPLRDAGGALRRIDLGRARLRSRADALALDALCELADLAVAPLLRELAQAGCVEIDVVPADDLHLLPWGYLRRGWAPDITRLDVYPTAAAWLRCRSAGPSGAWPRWTHAGAAGSATAPRLPWVEVERSASARLWQRRPASLSAADGCRALLALGHGDMPRGNPARARLQLADGAVLDAHEAAGGGFDRVLLSACVLGRTDDAFGEALGFLSACFGYRTRFGVGWLTEVGDDAACLFSLALQFALRAAVAERGAAARWGEVFDAACHAIERGQWPPGFAAWIGGRPLVGDAALPAQPPAALQRVLPWVAVLGG